MENQKLGERSSLMRLSAGLPAQNRQDRAVTAEVSAQKGIASGAGKWVKSLDPDHALQAIKTKLNEAREYHARVTLPYGCTDESDGAPAIAGLGILPAALIVEYLETIGRFQGELAVLASEFTSKGDEWIAWARQAHNGTFEPSNYPGCTSCGFELEVFKAAMAKKVYLRYEPMPVPNSSHFASQVSMLLGTDAESVNIRVADAEREAKREVVRRMIEPVRAMAEKLAETPKCGRDDIVFRDSLIGNLRDIAALAPKLNIFGDPKIDEFAQMVGALGGYNAQGLREDKGGRAQAQAAAAATLQRLSGYSL